MKSKIWIDGSFLAPRYTSCGINTYLVNLLRELPNINGCVNNTQVNILISPRTNSAVRSLHEQSSVRWKTTRAMQLPKLWRTGIFLGAVGAAATDTFFFPSPVPLHFKACRLAVTIHDLIPLLFPDQFKSVSGRLLRHSFQSSLSRADLILTDSEYSKKDLISVRGVHSSRIVVAPLGFRSDLFNVSPTDFGQVQEVLTRHRINQPYLLHVGYISPRKNLVRLVRAYQVMTSRETSPQVRLVLCGRLGWDYQELLDLVHTEKLRDRVILTGSLPDQELAILYKNAIACVMPSLYEGFGLPLLEAMACGTPAISSNRSCLPEIGGDAIVYFDPESVEEMAEIIGRVVNDGTLRETMVDRGLKRSQLFSWGNCARKTLAALRQL